MSIEDRDPGVAPAAETEESGTSTTKAAKKQLPLWQETILLLAIAMVLAVVIKAFFVQAFYIPSPSMEPGLVKDDRILVQKVSLWAGEPKRGDVVVFKDPGDWLGGMADQAPNPALELLTKVGLYPEGGHLVKRVVGVEGDVIHCCDTDGNLQINGESVDESGYVKDDPGTTCNGPMPSPQCNWTAGPVPADHIFVMGDNRGHSADSSYHICRKNDTTCRPGDEFVSNDLVVGKVFVLLWPMSRFHWFSRPDSLADVPAAQ